MFGARGLSACTMVVGLALLTAPGSTTGQPASDGELPPLMDEAAEIALALSAAPGHVTQQAAVFVLKRGGYVKVREGKNGFTCLVDRYWSRAIEPTCLNPEASATLLPVVLRRAELRERGYAMEEIDSEIDAGYARGAFRLPEKLAIGYMFSSAQDLYTDDGRHLGAWIPHVMIYVPYLTPDEIGGRGPGAIIVFRAGRRDAAMIVAVPESIKPGTSG